MAPGGAHARPVNLNNNNKTHGAGAMKSHKTHAAIPIVPDLADPMVSAFAAYAQGRQRLMAGDFDGAAEAISQAHTAFAGLESRSVRDIRLLALAKTGRETGQETGRLAQQLSKVFGVPVDQAFLLLTGGADDQ